MGAGAFSNLKEYDMPVVKPSLPKGTRDFLPEQMTRRQHVFRVVQGVFEKFGYAPLQTPSLEKLKVLSGKYGDEGEQLIFKVLRRGTGAEKLLRDKKTFTVHNLGELVNEALRYDLTVPLSRVVAMYHNDLVFPFKRYQVQPVWRADRPQRGRYREFYQCDVDTVGTSSMLADAETINVVYEVLAELGFKKFAIRLNNRKILDGMLESAGIPPDQGSATLITIDKLDKIGLDGVEQELLARGLSADQVRRMFGLLEAVAEPRAALETLLKRCGTIAAIAQGADELLRVVGHLHDLGVPDHVIRIDHFLVRGLGYYTGPIHESVVEEPTIGSLSGGGRYDRLIGMFLGRDIPACGTALGIERIIDVMEQQNMFPPLRTNATVLVVYFSRDTEGESLSYTHALRATGLSAEMYPEPAKLKKQFSYANKKDISFVVIIGSEEAAEGAVTIKDMSTGEQQKFSRQEGLTYLGRNVADARKV